MEKVLIALAVLAVYCIAAIAIKRKVYRDIVKLATPRLRVHFARQLESRTRGESTSIALLWPIRYPIWLFYERKQMKKEFLIYDTIKYIFG